MRAAGSCALVVGGGFGLGEATARALAHSGADVVIADIDEEAGERVARSISARFVHTDVRVTDQVQAAIAALPGPLRISVQCAGIGWRPNPAENDSAETLASLERMLSLHLVATFTTLRAAAAAMVDTPLSAGGERGVCINTASVLHADGPLRDVAFAASRGIMAGMSLPDTAELNSLGVRVATLTPELSGLGAVSGGDTSAEDYAALVSHVIENSLLRGEVQTRDATHHKPPR